MGFGKGKGIITAESSAAIPAAFLPSFPRKRESRTVLRQTRPLPIGHFGIPAYAGMTVEGRLIPFYTDPKSCLSCLSMFESVSPWRGKDGGISQIQ